MKKYLITLLFLIAFGIIGAYTQTLKAKLEHLKSMYDFSYIQLDVDSTFNEKYLIYFKQPLGSGGETNIWFDQRVIISHSTFDKPVIFVTEGYAADYALSPGFNTELTQYLDANQVCVEHRYFGESRPESINWKYLTVENSANDLHRVVNFIKDIYSTKIISTGISKGGQTTNFYSYFFPEDVDIYVSYVAPLNFSTEDRRVYGFLENVGDQYCRDRILNYQKVMLRNKDAYLDEFKKLAEKRKLTYSMGYEKAYELLVFEYPFAFWQWSTIECGNFADSISNPVWMVSHLDKVSGIDWISVEGIKRLQPFFYQAMHEIGMYGYDIEDFKGLTTYTHNPIFDFSFPEGIEVEFEPELMQRVDYYIRHKAENMIFIYGENDPWSATSVDLAGQTNSVKIIKKNGSHTTRIKNLPEDQKNQVLDSINSWLSKDDRKTKKTDMEKKKKVTGIGGIFFKSNDPAKMRDWYNTNLGLVTNDYGSLFEFRQSDNPEIKGYLQWGPFDKKTTYFNPSEKEFMINYRVENIEELVEELKKNGVVVLDEIETYEYGKFVHILDPENNKIELWEPIDSVFTELYDGKTTK